MHTIQRKVMLSETGTGPHYQDTNGSQHTKSQKRQNSLAEPGEMPLPTLPDYGHDPPGGAPLSETGWAIAKLIGLLAVSGLILSETGMSKLRWDYHTSSLVIAAEPKTWQSLGLRDNAARDWHCSPPAFVAVWLVLNVRRTVTHHVATKEGIRLLSGVSSWTISCWWCRRADIT